MITKKQIINNMNSVSWSSLHSKFVAFLIIGFVALGGLSSLAYAESEKTCSFKVTNCSGSDESMYICTFDQNDVALVIAEDTAILDAGKSDTISCKNKDGKCDTFGTAKGSVVCDNLLSVKKDNYCGDLYFKFSNNLWTYGAHVNTTSCSDFNF